MTLAVDFQNKPWLWSDQPKISKVTARKTTYQVKVEKQLIPLNPIDWQCWLIKIGLIPLNSIRIPMKSHQIPLKPYYHVLSTIKIPLEVPCCSLDGFVKRRHRTVQCGPPNYVCWFINPNMYSYLRTINHTYWKYVHQLRYRKTVAQHIVIGLSVGY